MSPHAHSRKQIKFKLNFTFTKLVDYYIHIFNKKKKKI